MAESTVPTTVPAAEDAAPSVASGVEARGVLANSEAASQASLATGLPLPFALVSFVDHWRRAHARFWSQMARVDNPIQAAHAEEGLGLEMVHDVAQAWIDFYGTPMRLLSAAMTARLPPSQPSD